MNASDDRPEVAGKGLAALSVAPGVLLSGLTGLFGLDNLLLLRFPGVAAPMAYILEAVLLAIVLVAMARWSPKSAAIPISTIAKCLLVAVIVLLLGGEGHVLYANVDWQVRDAVLHDMTTSPWPYVYTGQGAPVLLRAPIGMYLLPALIGKWGGYAVADWLLLAQNAAMLAAILALGSMVFDTPRSRRIALVVILSFSGMDTIGVLLTNRHLWLPLTTHIEGWAGIQYSSMITLAFWVPQHAFAGWFGAMLFLLWHRRVIPLVLFLAPMPLVALWSPFGVAGTLPFALLAAFVTIGRRQLRASDVAIPLLASFAALPALVYMAAGSGAVGSRIVVPDLRLYACLECFEVLPFLICVALGRPSLRDKWLLGLVTAILLLLPLLQVGRNCDFMMRASVPALTILAVLVTMTLLRFGKPVDGDRTAIQNPSAQPRVAVLPVLVAVLLIGAITPLREVGRAIVYRPSPSPRCALIKAFAQSFADQGIEHYVVPLTGLPMALRPHDAFALSPDGAGPCWDRSWMTPR